MHRSTVKYGVSAAVCCGVFFVATLLLDLSTELGCESNGPQTVVSWNDAGAAHATVSMCNNTVFTGASAHLSDAEHVVRIIGSLGGEGARMTVDPTGVTDSYFDVSGVRIDAAACVVRDSYTTQQNAVTLVVDPNCA